jgi:hypothetical protein
MVAWLCFIAGSNRSSRLSGVRRSVNEGGCSLLLKAKSEGFFDNSINNESWLNKEMMPHHKAIRQQQFNAYVYDEVIPFIKNSTSWDTR